MGRLRGALLRTSHHHAAQRHRAATCPRGILANADYGRLDFERTGGHVNLLVLIYHGPIFFKFVRLVAFLLRVLLYEGARSIKLAIDGLDRDLRAVVLGLVSSECLLLLLPGL
jgi:hypothetical protein